MKIPKDIGKRLLSCVFFLVICNAFADQTNTKKIHPKTAKEVVLVLQDELLRIMKQGKELGFEKRYKQLENVINQSYDLNKIAQIVLGREWKKLSDEQKLSFTTAFSKLSISTYAHNFKEFSGESFAYVSEDATDRGYVISHTIFVFPDEDNIKFDYMLKKQAGNWRIINIITDGVSDLALKKSEYTSLLKREGFNALITKINKKIDTYKKL